MFYETFSKVCSEAKIDGWYGLLTIIIQCIKVDDLLILESKLDEKLKHMH